MSGILRIGTRDSQLAVWQATWVQNLLKNAGVDSELVYIKSEGDIDTVTPLYALGVTGVFTKTLDAALLNNRIDIAVHSMKDVPVQLPQGIIQAAVLQRASWKDILVYKNRNNLERPDYENDLWSEISNGDNITIATSSVRRIAQWKRRYPNHNIENLRGNVNTRLKKLEESHWTGAIFAAAGLERIQLRPPNSIDLDWMLPAPAQGAIMVVCRENDSFAAEACQPFNHEDTDMCTKIERSFLSALMGGCSTPVSALAEISNHEVRFKGHVIDPESFEMAETELVRKRSESSELGKEAAERIMASGGKAIMEIIRKKGLKADE